MRIFVIIVLLLTVAVRATGQNCGLYNGLINVKDPAYGAKGDNVTNDTAAIQGAVNAACAAVNGIYSQQPAVFIPSGVYLVSAPIILKCFYPLHIFGAGQDSTVLNMSGYSPVIYVEPNSAALTLGSRNAAPLATGTGNSLSWGSNTASQYFYSLKDSTTATNAAQPWKNVQPLSGMGALSVEMFINFAATGSNGINYYIMSSAGSDAPGGTVVQDAIDLYVTQGTITSTLHACLTTSVTGNACVSGPITNATTEEIELSYDGSNLRLFAGTPGGMTTQLGTTAMTGMIVQSPAQSFYLGWKPLGPFAMNYSTAAGYGTDHWQGQLDSIRFSSAAQHTAIYTAPTAKFTNAAGTICLINGTSFPDTLLQVDIVNGSGGGGLIPAYYVGSVLSGTQRNQIDNLSLRNGSYGVFVWNSINGSMNNLRVNGQSVAGIKLWNDAYGWMMRNLNITAATSAEADIETGYLSGLQNFEGLSLSGAFYGMVLGSGGLINTMTYYAGNNSLAGLWATSDLSFQSTSVTEFVTDVESGGRMVPLHYVGQGNLQFIGGNIQANSADCSDPAIILDATSGMAAVTFIGTNVSMCASGPEIISLVHPTGMTSPVEWMNGTVNGAAFATESRIPLITDSTYIRLP